MDLGCEGKVYGPIYGEELWLVLAKKSKNKENLLKVICASLSSEESDAIIDIILKRYPDIYLDYINRYNNTFLLQFMVYKGYIDTIEAHGIALDRGMDSWDDFNWYDEIWSVKSDIFLFMEILWM